jgi:hypothetical protein
MAASTASRSARLNRPVNPHLPNLPNETASRTEILSCPELPSGRFCGIYASFFLVSAKQAFRVSTPKSRSSPPSGDKSPRQVLRSVVLPAPLGPTKPKTLSLCPFSPVLAFLSAAGKSTQMSRTTGWAAYPMESIFAD